MRSAQNEMFTQAYVCFTFDVRLNGVLEGKCYMAAQKAAFIVSGRIVWRYMGAHQRGGAICAVVALERLIPCVYGLSGTFKALQRVLVRKRKKKAVRGVFLWLLLYIMLLSYQEHNMEEVIYYSELYDFRKENDLTMSQLIRRMIKEFLKNHQND